MVGCCLVCCWSELTLVLFGVVVNCLGLMFVYLVWIVCLFSLYIVRIDVGCCLFSCTFVAWFANWWFRLLVILFVCFFLGFGFSW